MVYGDNVSKNMNCEKYDEFNTLAAFYPTILSCSLESGEKIQVIIFLSKHISLKINDKFCKNNLCE